MRIKPEYYNTDWDESKATDLEKQAFANGQMAGMALASLFAVGLYPAAEIDPRMIRGILEYRRRLAPDLMAANAQINFERQMGDSAKDN